ESYKAVYNWQFVHCLDFWTNVLAVYCDPSHNLGAGESPMQPLVYPLVQVALGVVRTVLPASLCRRPVANSARPAHRCLYPARAVSVRGA
ncbi:Noc2p family-domain-containing protein, partial [Jimgerdemannia flammicorona]